MSFEPRDALLVLKCHLDRIGEGNGRLVFVRGGLASGKTQVLHDFLHYAAGTGALVLMATGSRSEHSLDVGVIEQLFHNTELPPEFTERVSCLMKMDILASGGPAVPSQEAQSGRLRLLLGICNLLLDLSRGQPVVISIDDIHFADTLSLQILLYLLH